MEEKVRVIERVFDIFELLGREQGEVSLTEISNLSGMSKSTVHRLLKTMCERGYVRKGGDHRYALGEKFVELASYHINNLELQTEAKSFLKVLYAELGLTVHLGALEGNQIVYIEKLDLYPNTISFTQVGYKTPAYCSSIGKCLMACLSGEELDEILYTTTFEKYTKNTITNLYEFKKHLREVRRNGWAMDNEEHLPGHRCIASPIYNYLGTAIAAVSVSGDVTQIPEERILIIAREVKKTAEMISRRMGYSA